jgi:2-hydroxy-6-oxonona-2,4-dienedioate hydrolase
MSSITRESTSHMVRVTEGPLKDFNIHYNDAGSGEVVAMLHGSGPGASGWSNFNRNVEAFVQAGYRVLLIDQPGWSQSDPIVIEKGARCVYNSAAIKGVLDALKIDKAHLIGNSMGGTTALQFALDHPDRIGKLIVMGGGGVGQSLFVPMPPEGIKLILQLYKQPTLDNLKKMLNVFVYDASALTEELMQGRLKSMMDREDHLRNFVQTAEVNPHHQFVDFTSRLKEVKAPTLVTWGRDDRFVPLDSGLRLIWGLQDAELHVFSKCGHWAQWEHANKFNRLVLEFLKR